MSGSALVLACVGGQLSIFFFKWWAKRCQASYPVCGQVLLQKETTFCDFLFASLDKEAFPTWDQFVKEIICS